MLVNNTNYAYEIECPQCGSALVKIIDRGIKYYLRKILNDNRYICLGCNVTWREKNPERYLNIRKKHGNLNSY
jgi:transposase-like protein